MKRSILRWASAIAIASGLALQASADTIINTFDTPVNYVLNGIIGEPNWDGVYLRFGDVLNGGAGGSGGGATQQANTTDNAGFFSVTTSGTDWSGTGDDGFFLFKVVSGDFDMSVETVNPYDNRANNFCGLLARVYNPNNSGSPYRTNGNVQENWVGLFRMNQFNDDGEIRQAFNGGNAEFVYGNANPSNNIDVNTTRFLRITRTGDLFSFYLKTNDVDAWIPLTNASGMPSGATNRADLHGLAMQVGMSAAAFSTAQRFVFFDNFTLSATNVSATQAVMPGTPSNIITTDTNIAGSLTFSWTVGTPGDSSLVVMKRTTLIQVNPVQGITYVATNAFGNTNALIGSGESVVYSGTGNSVTVTNLAANNVNFSIAVYEYTNTPNGPSYNTTTPTTNSFPGPGLITGAFLTAASTNLPVGGATSLKLFGTFSTGEILDETASSSWNNSDGSIAFVDPVTGTVTGLAPGTTTVTGTFGTNNPTIVLTVTPAPFAFVDNFSSTNDYAANGIIGSRYDGLYLNFGDVPGAIAAGADGNGFTPALNSQITTTNGLYMSSVQSDWEGTADDGPFLFKIVPGTNSGVSGDFQATVHINNMNTLNGSVAGIMARVYNQNNLTNGGPGPGNAENHVNYWKVQNGTTSIRKTQAGALTTVLAAGPSATDGWLLIQRTFSTNFYFYERPTTNDNWIFTGSTVMLQASNNAPMQVGVANQATTGVNGVATFDSFSIDALGVASATPIPAPASNLAMTLNGDLSMTVNWVAADGSGNPIPSILVMRQGAPVSSQPPVGVTVTGNSVFKSGTDLGGGNFVVFVSATPPASTNNTVTVTGLTSGQTYYATAYTFAGTGVTKVFNPVTSATGNLIDALITNILVTVPSVPRGGISTATVQGMTTVGPISISTAGAVYSSDNTNVMQVLSTVVTGVTNGTANLTVVLGGFTNKAAVIVRDPSFTDEFAVQHDYLIDGVTNTAWDGLYNTTPATNPVPGSRYVGLANSGASVASSPITNVVATGTNVVGGVTNIIYSTNVVSGLNIQSSGDGWENAASGGFFLYKYVPGNFQMSVHIQSFTVGAFNQPGILARGYAISNGVAGYPMGYAVTNGGGTNTAGEYWVDLTRFDEFNIGTYARRNLDGAVTQNTQTDQGDSNFWLLIIRSGNGSQFDFYKRAAITDPWRQIPSKQHYSLAQFANRPMQVGVMAGPFNGTGPAQLPVTFEHFMLDTTSGSALTITPSGSNLIISWPNVPGTLEHTTTLNPANWQAVPGTPVLGATGYSIAVPATPGGNDYFRLKQ